MATIHGTVHRTLCHCTFHTALGGSLAILQDSPAMKQKQQIKFRTFWRRLWEFVMFCTSFFRWHFEILTPQSRHTLGELSAQAPRMKAFSGMHCKSPCTTTANFHRRFPNISSNVSYFSAAFFGVRYQGGYSPRVCVVTSCTPPDVLRAEDKYIPRGHEATYVCSCRRKHTTIVQTHQFLSVAKRSTISFSQCVWLVWSTAHVVRKESHCFSKPRQWKSRRNTVQHVRTVDSE